MPKRSKTVVIGISIPADLRDQLKNRAIKEGRNFSNLITHLLSKEMKKEKAACTG